MDRSGVCLGRHFDGEVRLFRQLQQERGEGRLRGLVGHGPAERRGETGLALGVGLALGPRQDQLLR